LLIEAGGIARQLDVLIRLLTKTETRLENKRGSVKTAENHRENRNSSVSVLLFSIPPCSPEKHAIAFAQVAGHVRSTFGCEVEESGKDVARASFVSFDRGGTA
jgi:hypothetical protein